MIDALPIFGELSILLLWPLLTTSL